MRVSGGWLAAVVALVAGGMATVGGCRASGGAVTPGAAAEARLGEAILTVDQAIAVAKQHLEGQVIEVEGQPRSWGTRYEVALLRADGSVAEVKIDGRDGAVIQVEDPKPLQPDQKARVAEIGPLLGTTKVSFSQALASARAVHPSGWAKGVELEADDGRLNYEVEIFENQAWVRIEVDGRTGEAEER